MKPDALELLSMVAAFLDETVAGQVPPALRSDVRAAAKTLANAREELDVAFPLLLRECGELSNLIAKAQAALGSDAPTRTGDKDSASQAQSLGALNACHARLSEQLGDRILALQGRNDAEAQATLHDIYTALRTQAGRRLGWQSVFAPDMLVSDVLRGTWQGKV